MRTRIGSKNSCGSRALASLFGFLAWALPHSVHATIMIELPMTELADGAEVVVRGTVEKVGVRGLLVDGEVQPVTITSVRVTEWIKGRDRQAIVEIRQEGGKIGGYETVVDGAAKFSAGEDVVVFLHRDAQAFRTWQMSQGKFRVVTRRVDGQHFGFRDLDGVTFAAWDKGGEMKFRMPAATAVPLDELLGIARRGKLTKVSP